MKSVLKNIMDGNSLSEVEAFNLLSHIAEDNIHEAQIGAILGALRTKGETSDEISGFAKYLKQKAVPFPYQTDENETLIDTCGTGGDDTGSFNISTAVAFVLASGGVKVAKHGNRSVSSRCGCADVLEELKIPLNLSPEESAENLKNNNFTFLFAPAYHPSFKKLAKIRKSIQVRTIFNLLGPLLNPASVKRQLVGVFDGSYVYKMADALKKMGHKEAMVVNGHDGMDEFSISGPTHVAHLKDNKINELTFKPEDFGFERASLEDIKGGTKRENANLLEKILSGKMNGAKKNIVSLNAGAAFYIVGKTDSFKNGVSLASSLMAKGNAYEALNNLRVRG